MNDTRSMSWPLNSIIEQIGDYGSTCNTGGEMILLVCILPSTLNVLKCVDHSSSSTLNLFREDRSFGREEVHGLTEMFVL